ncbi:Uncharacterized protein FWK35_00024210 [Aphis craccivora]|uniref:Uncharacterized protein n=1 Tax=Aphis craccivora TaxID=307492 RepID=A0A6G0Y855_APHCR|nr:Uncharacterized protein FWK35_00024210 [Aphis craccivora]
MLKAINLFEKDVSSANESQNTRKNDEILNDVAEIHSNISSSDDKCRPHAGRGLNHPAIIYGIQIENLLNEDIEYVDSTYEQTEQILNEIQLQNLGDGSIFTGIRCVAHTRGWTLLGGRPITEN